MPLWGWAGFAVCMWVVCGFFPALRWCEVLRRLGVQDDRTEVRVMRTGLLCGPFVFIVFALWADGR
jgi:hypothetical protein